MLFRSSKNELTGCQEQTGSTRQKSFHCHQGMKELNLAKTLLEHLMQPVVTKLDPAETSEPWLVRCQRSRFEPLHVAGSEKTWFQSILYYMTPLSSHPKIKQSGQHDYPSCRILQSCCILSAGGSCRQHLQA